MKTSIVIAEGMKQIMLTPENETDVQVINLITEDDEISVDFQLGEFFDNTPQPIGYQVQKCNGGYLRAYKDEQSLMLILKNKKEK